MPDVWNEIALGRNRVRAALVAADGLSSQQVGENVTLSESLLLPPLKRRARSKHTSGS